MRSYTASQAARILGVSLAHLREHIRTGKLKVTRIQKFETRITDDDLTEYRERLEELGEFAFVGDGCLQCHTHSNLPTYKVSEDERSVTLRYRCEQCGRVWQTSWEKDTALDQIPFTLQMRRQMEEGK